MASKDGFKRFTVLSLGAGVQSSTLALMCANGMFPKYNIRAALFADTQAEPASVYKWLDWLEKEIAQSVNPFPVIRCTRGSLSEDSLVIRKSKKTGAIYLRTLMPMFNKQADGSKRMLIRKCTKDYKLDVLHREMRKLIGREDANLSASLSMSI